jgi:hypothetical protein
MRLRFWRKDPDREATEAVEQATARLAQAEGSRRASVQTRLSLAEIRRKNHFGPSIFPTYEGKRP